MKKTKKGYLLLGSILSPVLLLVIGIFGRSTIAEASVLGLDVSSCYEYNGLDSGSTVAVAMQTSDGNKFTMTLPNQNPPSILQAMHFVNSETCGSYEIGDYSSYNGIVLGYAGSLHFYNPTFTTSSNGNLPFSGDPFVFQSDPTDPNQPYWLEPMQNFDYEGISDMGSIATENAVINTVDNTGLLKIKVASNLSINDNSFSGQYANLSAPATNCVSLGGNGPDKIVFARGASWNSSVADFLYQANNVINNGFRKIDPYKTYFNQFSFYADLNSYQDSTFKTTVNNSTSNGTMITFTNPESAISVGSSCQGSSSTPPPKDYIFFFSNPSMYWAWSDLGAGFTFYNMGVSNDEENGYINNNIWPGLSQDQIRAGVVIHETGHAIAGLLDEYLYNTTGNIVDFVDSSNDENTENCTSNPSRDYRGPDGHLYGAYLDKGCSYLLNSSIIPGSRHPSAYYRPSDNSIMYEAPNGVPEFNVISCGYVVAAIDDQSLTQIDAAMHWPLTDYYNNSMPGCSTMAKNGTVISDDIPPVANPPVINGVNAASSVSTPNTFDVSGSGFTPTGNAVKLTPVSADLQGASVFDAFMDFLRSFIGEQVHAQTDSTYYEIDDITDATGTPLSFVVPTSTPDGTYLVSVSALNSSWTDTSYKIVVSGDGSGDPTTAVNAGSAPATTTSPISQYSDTVTATPAYSCPSGYTLTSSNACYRNSSSTSIPASIINATPSYYCPNGSAPINFPGYGYPGNKACTGIYVAAFNPASVSYSCPSGSTKTSSGTQCSIPASTLTSPSSTVNASVVYSCPTGYALSTTACNINSVPISLAAAASVKGQVNLSWNDNNVPNAVSINIERATATSTVFVPIASVGPSVTAYVDSGLPPSTLYQYRIDMTLSQGSNNLNGTGAYTPIVKATTAAKPSTPGLNIGTLSSTALTLSVSDGDAGIASYNFYASSSPQNTLLTSSTTNKSYMVSGLLPNTKYCYFASASINPLNISALSAPVCATTVSDAPTAVTAAATIKGSVSLKWDDNSLPSESAVSVERATSTLAAFIQVANLPSKTTSYVDVGLPPSATYIYRIRSQYPTGNGAYSTNVSVTTLGRPATPTVAAAAISSNAISVKWQDTDAAIIKRYSLMPTTPLGLTVLSYVLSTSTVLTGLSPSTNYCYTVTASINLLNTSATSTPACAKTPVASISTTTAVAVPLPVAPINTQQDGTVSPTVTYTCPAATALNGQSCFAAVSSPGTSSSISYSCPAGYSLTSNKEYCVRGFTTLAATVVYTCSTKGTTLNPTDKKCYGPAATSTLPATPAYSCPSGYVINSNNTSCIARVTIDTTTNTFMANVWSSFVNLFNFAF